MKTSRFLTTLRTHATLPLVFQSGRHVLAPGFHLTEVKRVTYETMDCGAQTHRWNETQFELWVPASAEPDRGSMPAGKFLRIVDRVEAEVPLQDDAVARIHASLGPGPAALYDVVSATVQDARLVFELAEDRTRCKAAERRQAAQTRTAAGVSAEAGGCGCEAAPTAACGCDPKSQPETVAACCA